LNGIIGLFGPIDTGHLRLMPTIHGKMWSRSFLIWGLVTGTVAAALALFGLWVMLEAASLGFPFMFCLPGLLLYPACWYAVVFRTRNYSSTQVVMLVAATFGAVWLLLFIIMTAAGIYVSLTMIAEATNQTMAARAPNEGAAALLVVAAAAPLALPLMTLFGAIILPIPYFVVATPVAFLHRAMLLNTFGRESGGENSPWPRGATPGRAVEDRQVANRHQANRGWFR